MNYFPRENIFTKKINKLYGTVVALELSTKLLSIIKIDGQSKDIDEITSGITKNELQGMQYFGGYIFQKLYIKFTNSIKWEFNFDQQCINIILAAPTDKNGEQILNNIRDRGGLWLITDYCQNIFPISETIFCEKTKTVTNKNKLFWKILVLIPILDIFVMMQHVVLRKKFPYIYWK